MNDRFQPLVSIHMPATVEFITGVIAAVVEFHPNAIVTGSFDLDTDAPDGDTMMVIGVNTPDPLTEALENSGVQL